MPISVHVVVLTADRQFFTLTDDQLPASQSSTGDRDRFKKQQKHSDKPFKTANVCHQGKRPCNGKVT